MVNDNKINKFVIKMILVYYLPVVCIWADIIPFRYRFHVLIIMAALMGLYAIFRKTGFKVLGISTELLKHSFLWNGLVSISLVVTLCYSYVQGYIRQPTVPDWDMFFIFYVFISSPAQEYLYRSLIFYEMNIHQIKSPVTQITVSAINYCFLHVIYNDLITLGVTFFMGVIWGIIYYKYPNFWGVTVSHATLGVVSITVGLV